MKPSETIADRTRALRDQRGWSQRDLAERAGVTQQTINRWEHGQLDEAVVFTRLNKLADAFGVPRCELIGCEDAA